MAGQVVLRLGGRSGWKATPLTWLPARRADGAMTAWVVCARGHVGLIDEHEISADGTVSPSVVCTENGCGWHEHIRLEGWKP